MRLNTMLAAADDSPDRPLSGNVNANSDFNLDFSSVAERHVAESVSQELDYWERLVFSFDMERDSGAPSHSDTRSSSRGRTERRGQQAQRAGVASASSGPRPSSSSTSQIRGQPPIDHARPPVPSFPPGFPNMQGQASNAQLSQLSQLAGLDPYTLAHLAALSALQQGQQPPGPGTQSPGPSDPAAVLRQLQALLYPFGNAGQGAAQAGGPPQDIPQGIPHGFPQPQPQASSSRRHASGSSASSRTRTQQTGQTAAAEPSGQRWPPPGMGSLPFAMPPIDPSLISQLSQLPPLALPNAYYPPAQTPGAGPSSGSRARSTSTASTGTPSTPVSPTTSRADNPVDDAAMSEDKRRRNTLASARFRIKKKHKTLALERSVVELEAQADDLEREASELRRENGWLKEMLIMKGRSVRAQATAAAAELEEGEEEGEDGSEAEIEEDASDDNMAEDASNREGKGKEKAS